ncbi:MAG: secretin N-terminal domain-containing protein, partial [Planctomycetota bacterium]
RTNSIIAKGAQSRIDKLREAMALLDVPATAGGRAVRTFSLARLAPQEAAAKLNQLYAKLPEDQRPTVLELADVGKVTLVGSATAISEAAALLAEIDGGGTAPREAQRSITVVALAHAEPDAVAAAAKSLLNGRQLVTLKMIPGPDRRSLIVSGTTADVEAVRMLLPVLDQPPHLDRTVRLVRLTTIDPQRTVDRARELYLRQVDAADPRWALALELDPGSRVLTSIGPEAAQDRFAGALRMVEDHAVVDRETRQIEIAHAEPSRLVAPLTALGRQLLEPRDGSKYVPPEIEAVDPLDLLVVTALPGQFPVLDSLVATLDRPGPGDFQLRVVQLSGADPTALIRKAGFVYERLSQGLDPDDRPAPAAEFDPLTGNLLITGRAESVRTYEKAVAEARKLLPPSRTGRLIELREASAADVIGPLRELLATTAPVDPARTVPEPTIELVERTNSLYIVAEPPQHQMIERSVRLLDRYEPTELPPLQLLQVRAAEATQLSNMLRKRYNARPAEQRREQPVEIDADAGTNTLIVTAHRDVFDEIKQFVDTINRSGEAERETMIFSLNRARAADLAQALDRLYPRPPMPVDRRGRPMPHLQEPKEVHVSADPATNTLIVEAPAERRAQFEALVEQLDRVQLPPKAELRTYHIERGDPGQIARTLNDLARQGVMSETPPDGRQPVQVTVLAEPVSRTLIVAGDELTFAKTEEVLTDLQAVPIRRSLRVVEVTGTDPQDMADQAQRLYQEQSADIPDATEVSIEVDADNSTLLVVADDEAMLLIVSILNQLQDSIGPPPDVELIALEFQSAESTVEFLEDLATSALGMMGKRMGPPPVFAAIERTNSVLIGAQRDQQAIIGSLVQSFDKPETQEMPPLRILQLRTADADNLARALMRQYDRRKPEERQERPVTIASDPNTNALIVAAHPDMMPEIADVVDELNRQELYGEEGREIRIFPLRVARAQELARTIDEMYPPPPVPRDRRGRPLYHLQMPREVVVRADDQTNALIVDAPIKRMAGFDKLVEQLDRQQIIAESEVRTYRVVHADLNALRATLQQLSVGGGLSPAGRDRRIPISINVEPVSRSLVVSGPSDIFERVEKVLSDLDAKRAAPATSLRFFKLANARAETLVPMLREILLRRLAEDVKQAGPDAAELLNISADRKTNTLIISAPPEIMPIADALISELDHPRAAVEAVDVRIFQLTQADAGQVATAVRQAVDARARADGEPLEATIAPEPSSNSIVVTAPPQDVARIESLIESLDGAPPAGKVQVRTVFLEYARAERLTPIIAELLAREELLDVNRLPSWQRMQFLQMQLRQGGPEPTVRVAADTRLNAIVISAPPALLNVAEQMVAQLDVDPADVGAAGRRSVRVLVVDNADAAQLAGSLEAIFAEDPDAPPTIRVDPASNSLLVVATDSQYQTIENVVREIDQATIATSRQMRMIPLDPSKASARELARTLQRIIGRRRGTGGVQIITVDELLERKRTRDKSGGKRPGGASRDGPGAMLWSRPPAADGQSMAPASRARRSVAPVQHAVAALVFAAQSDEEDDEAEPLEPGVTIAVDPDTNSLIIVGAPRSIERVADLARQLLDQIPAAPGKIRYIGLPEGVDARTTSTLIVQTISQMTPPGGRRGDLRRRVAVIADQTNNALIVTCNEADFEIVGDLVAALSQPSTTEQIVVKVYALETVTADRAAESVRRMLEPEQARGPRRGRQAQRMRDLAVKLLVDDQAIEAVFNPARVRVSSDPQNNALIVMGPPEAIGFVDEFIELLDQTPVNVQTTLKLYPLQHAQASNLRNTLRNIFRVRYQSLRGQPGASAIQPEFAVDERTNTLLVTAAPEQLAEVDALLKELDRGLGEDRQPLRTIELSAIQPQQAATILDKVVIGSDQKRRSTTVIVADDAAGVLLVRAPEEVMAEIDEVVAEIDRAPTREFKIRTIMLEKADANTVANALQRLYDDRARIASAGRGRRQQSRRVSIIGDRNSNMLLVAASDEDFAGIQELVSKFDTPEASQALGFKVFQLKHAKATKIADTVQDLAGQIMWAEEGPFWWFGGRGQERQRSRTGTLAVTADSRLNALIVTGEGDKFEVVERLIEVLDAPVGAGDRRLVRLYRVQNADVDVVADRG